MINKIKSANGREISYKHLKNKSKISVLFCPGFNSDMNGNKASHIFDWCKNNNIECALFDYSGHGNSSGDFKNLGIEEWIEDTNTILDIVLNNPAIIIGSSMGGWIAINIAILNPSKVSAIIGIASAPDFTEKLWASILTKKQKLDIKKYGYTRVKSKYDSNGYIISKKLINSGKKYLITKNKEINVSCPIRLIHGDSDEEVTLGNSLCIFKRIKSKNIELTIIKNGDHRLSKPENLKTILSTLQNLKEELLR